MSGQQARRRDRWRVVASGGVDRPTVDYGRRVRGQPRSAFTLVELLVVIAIIGILIGLLLVITLVGGFLVYQLNGGNLFNRGGGGGVPTQVAIEVTATSEPAVQIIAAFALGSIIWYGGHQAEIGGMTIEVFRRLSPT